MHKISASRFDLAFASVCLLQGMSIAALDMGSPYLPMLFESLGVQGAAAQIAWTGWASGSALLLSVVCTPLWARWGDLHGRKTMLARAYLGLAVSLGAMAASSSPLAAVGARAVQGALAGVTPAALALVSTGGAAARRMSWIQSSALAGAMLGPILGGVLLGQMGPHGLYAAGCCVQLACAALTLLLLRESPHAQAQDDPPLPDAQGLAKPGLLAAWISAWRTMEDPVLAVFVRSLCGSRPDWGLWTGLALGVSRGTGLLAAPWWGRRADRLPELCLRRGLTGAAVLTAAQAVAPGPAVLVAIRAALGIFAAGIQTTLYADAARRGGESRRGTAIACISSGNRLGAGLGNAASAVLAAMLGLPGLFVAMGAGLAASIFFLPQTREDS